MNWMQALLLTASRDCKCQLRAGVRVSFSLKPQYTFGPGVPNFFHAITPSAPPMTILATRTILSRDPSSQTDKGAVAGGLAAAIAVIIAVLGLFFLRWWCTRASPTEFIADPVSDEAGVPMTINTQPEPRIEGIKGSSDDEAPGLSTMPDLPTPPMMKVYVRTSAPSFHSRMFILCPGLLGSEQCSNMARAPRRSVYQGDLFPGNFRTVSRHRNHARTSQHTRA